MFHDAYTGSDVQIIVNIQIRIPLHDAVWPVYWALFQKILLLEHEGRIKTDTLQKLHSVSNLAELLEAGHKVKDSYWTWVAEEMLAYGNRLDSTPWPC